MRTTSTGKAGRRSAEHPAIDALGVYLHECADGYYWRAKGVRRSHGPFTTLVDALDDIQRESGADLVGDPEDWIDDVGYEAAYPN